MSSTVTKRILHIIPTLDRSGAEKQLSLLARGLPRDEFDVHVCALTRGGPLQAELEQAGIPVTVIGKRQKFDPAAFLRLRRLVGQLRPDLCHTWLFAANAYGRAAGQLAGVKCLVAAERCVDPWKGRLELTIDRYLARRTARIVANSPGVRDFYVAQGLPAAKFEIIFNGVPTAAPCPTTRAEILAQLGLPENRLLIGVVGRLWPQKRVKDAIWAADLLNNFRSDLQVVVLGDGPERRALERFRDQIIVSGNFHFLGHRDDAARILPHFDLLWSPSAYEGQSNTIMEAMAAGVPVVATDIPGTRDLIVHGETGFLVPTRDRPAIAATVNDSVARGLAKHANQILNDRELGRRLGEAGQRRMREEFSVERMVQRHVELYRQLLL